MNRPASRPTALLVLTVVIAIGSGLLPGQEPPPPPEDGTKELLVALLEEHAAARYGPSPDAKRAEEASAKLLAHRWREVDVPKVVAEFATAKEQAVVDGKKPAWGFEALPRAIGRLTSDAAWAAWLDAAFTTALEEVAELTSKRALPLRKQTPALIRLRVLPKIHCMVAWDGSYRLFEIKEQDLAALQSAARRAFAGFTADTALKSTAYELLPAGLYLRYAGWLGDEKAFAVARAIVESFLKEPRPVAEDNVHEAAITLKTFVTARSGEALKREKQALIEALLNHSGVQEKTKALLRAPN